MARKLVETHHKRLQAVHKRHKKHLLKLFHRVKSHPACYKPGHNPTKSKAPKSLPKKPKGLNAKGSGLWDHVKKAWHWVTGKAKKHGKELYKVAKKHGAVVAKNLVAEGKPRATAYGQKALARGKTWAEGQAKAVGQNMRNRVEGYVKQADAKIRSVSDRIDKGVSKYTGGVGAMPGRTVKATKRGSGMGKGSAKQLAARRAFLDKYVHK